MKTDDGGKPGVRTGRTGQAGRTAKRAVTLALSLMAAEGAGSIPLTRKLIDLKGSELLMEERFDGAALDREKWKTLGAAAWQTRDGALEGEWDRDANAKHGQIFTRQAFKGDILMEFEAETVAPSDHDVIWWWNVAMDADGTRAETGYLGALGGWWSNKTGLEKIAKRAICAMTPAFALEPGKRYLVRSGAIGGHCFLQVDGKLVMELFDPQPFDPGVPGHVGFGVFQSHVRIRNLKVFRIKWSTRRESYD